MTLPYFLVHKHFFKQWQTAVDSLLMNIAILRPRSTVIVIIMERRTASEQTLQGKIKDWSKIKMYIAIQKSSSIVLFIILEPRAVSGQTLPGKPTVCTCFVIPLNSRRTTFPLCFVMVHLYRCQNQCALWTDYIITRFWRNTLAWILCRKGKVRGARWNVKLCIRHRKCFLFSYIVIEYLKIFVQVNAARSVRW